ncbi:ceramide synthase 2 [Hyalella azteca]|uniref:Ceramide synthase 2 n=1 Tax=Hyalella azteca TaxID=294128 RepID=A0A8B7N072_HYAAZ|nr:ceramide synthase 2 [Hyalella azteca]
MNATTITHWFWTDSMWVPEGYTWKDLESRVDLDIPDPKDLGIYPFIIAGYLLLIKYFILTPFVFTPLARYFIVKPKRNKLTPEVSTLERVSEEYGSYPPWKVVVQTATELGWTERQIQRWLRKEASSKVNRTISKFIECAWQITFYTICCSLEFLVLIDKPWLYDLQLCSLHFPFHSVTPGMWWCYMLSLGFYWTELLTHPLLPKRSDSRQNFLHHVCAIAILSFSWACNISRLAIINLLVLQCNDIPLQMAKISGYIGFKRTRDACFAVFVLVWFVTRLGIYPFHIMRAAFTLTFTSTGPGFHIYHVISSLMVLIFLMNMSWTHSIVVMIYNKLKHGHSNDVRSSDEEEEGESDECASQKHIQCTRQHVKTA